jgi:1-deoxy-D-xylulose-5-phosphate reductoisomerase
MNAVGVAKAKSKQVPEPGDAPRSVTILGATGSVGASTIDLIKRNPTRLRVEAVASGRNVTALAQAARDVGARIAVIADPDCYGALKEALAGSGIAAAAGEQALIEAAQRPTDWVMAAISGAVGLKPTMAAIERGATVALANKECLVCAGALFMRSAANSGATVLPVDSEHNALFQALGAGRREDVLRVILTASGGPFRTWTLDAIQHATPEQALRHPNWSMGPKITIDSATLMNKGLELIEAHHLFALAPEKLDVVVHPQSIVHALVTFHDGSIIAGMSVPDMRVPISHCLNWPERAEWEAPRLDLAQAGSLQFEAPDYGRFPALKLAREVLEAGGAAPTVLNAANEVAVEAFLNRRIGFNDIPGLVRDVLEHRECGGLREPASAEEAIAVDHVGRSMARTLLPQFAAKAS